MAAAPAFLTAAVLLVYTGVVLARAGGDPLTFARMGDGFVNGRPEGELGYDGQFAYFIALDPRPTAAAPHLDVPAYRYQRILYPLLAWVLALGQPGLIPWALLAVNLAAHVAGTHAVAALLAAHGVSRWYALAYGLWAGLVIAVRVDLTEPLSYALVAAALLAHQRGRLWLAATLIAVAVLAKETALLFALALLASVLAQRNRTGALAYGLALLPFGGLQVLLLRWFGSLGLASGGYMATPFEWLPYMGLLRVATISRPAFILLAAILVPMVVLPSAWGLVAAAGRLLRRDLRAAVWALGANAAAVALAPSSTFREPFAMARLASGLVLAVVVYGAQLRSQRMLRYSLFWIAAMALAIRD